MSIANAEVIERRRRAALMQPGAKEKIDGDVKFQCSGCAEEGHDRHQDNARFFQRDGSWGCAIASRDSGQGRAHWEAIGRQLGAFAGNRKLETPLVNGRQIVHQEEGLALVSVGELFGEPDAGTRWTVEDRLPAGGLGLLAGKPKAGKTTLARCLGLRVGRGESWLGFATTAGPVIVLSLEEKRQEVRDHFRALGATARDPIYLLCSSAPADALARLRREADRRRPALIIIDPLFRFVRVPSERGNDYATMTAALEPLLQLARETGAHVLAVHHLGKGERADGDAILGSTAIFAAVDTALILKRSERHRTLSSIQRYGDDLEEITLTLDPVTRDVTAGPPRAAVELAEASDLILAFLAKAADPVTEAELDGAIECRRQVWKKALRDLVGTGKVVRTGRGGKADPFRYSGSLKYLGTRELERVP